MQHAIELVVENVEKRAYGMTPCYPTGPGVLGRAIAATGIQASYFAGDFMSLTPLHRQRNLSFVMPSWLVIAQHKTTWCRESSEGDLKSMGLAGTNNYMDYWKARMAFGER
jgi:hypothetical protein